MKIGQLKPWQLSERMKQHLAWYLDNYTAIGFVTACNIARGDGEWRNKTIEEILRWGGVTERMVGMHTNKIMKYEDHEPSK